VNGGSGLFYRRKALKEKDIEFKDGDRVWSIDSDCCGYGMVAVGRETIKTDLFFTKKKRR